MPVVNEGRYAQDVLLSEFDHRYNRQEVVLTNDTAATLTLTPGMTVAGTGATRNIAESGDTVTGVLLTEHKDVAVSGTVTAVVLTRGPAIINSDRLTQNGGTASAEIAALLAIGIVSITEPAKSTTQDY